MPREVIMPALGMAQDTGLLVAWIKAEGDPVAEGDPLFEVETDKATMEVEAQGAGFLTNVRAKAGESVPVGGVIALISESAERSEEGAKPPEPEEEPDAGETAEADERPVEGRKIIMPALGMAQDTGRLVNWLVAPGDKVADGDPLFEVDTDKATMEVPSDTGGYVAAVYAEVGDDVPVGDVIAIISAEKPQTPVSGKKASTPPPAKDAATKEAPREETAPATPKPVKASSGRVLASPKARRLAVERGIDLSRLVEAGVEQPFHAADLDRPELSAKPADEARPTSTAQLLRITARASAADYDGFADWAQSKDAPSPLAAFAAGALRAATQAERVVIELRRPGAEATRRTDPDLACPAPEDDTPPALLLRDLTATRLTAVEGGSTLPVLTLSREGNDILVTLAADPDVMDEEMAMQLTIGLADRIADPMRQLF